MTDRKTKRVTYEPCESYRHHDLALGDFVAGVNEFWNSISEADRVSAWASFTWVDGGERGESGQGIEIYYDRPETDAEMAERLRLEAESHERYAREAKARDLEQLAALKRKYEPK